MTGDPPRAVPRVAILADDLMWATRLAEGVRRAGGEPIPVRTEAALLGALVAADACLVDLTARAYDGLAAVRLARESGVAVMAVGQHDDAELRRAARDAGAARVWAYRALFEHGERELGRWLAQLPGEPAEVEA